MRFYSLVKYLSEIQGPCHIVVWPLQINKLEFFQNLTKGHFILWPVFRDRAVDLRNGLLNQFYFFPERTQEQLNFIEIYGQPGLYRKALFSVQSRSTEHQGSRYRGQSSRLNLSILKPAVQLQGYRKVGDMLSTVKILWQRFKKRLKEFSESNERKERELNGKI